MSCMLSMGEYQDTSWTEIELYWWAIYRAFYLPFLFALELLPLIKIKKELPHFLLMLLFPFWPVKTLRHVLFSVTMEPNLESNCQDFNIKQTSIAACHPTCNSLLERTNRKVLEILRHSAGRFQAWDDCLCLVAASINSYVNTLFS